VTNAVKHFKWKARGTRRIHDKPSWSEQVACRPWLELELETVSPRGIVLLGATAAQSLLGRDFRVTRSRGRLLESDLADVVLATIHPSAVLRADDRDEAFAGLVDDLGVAAAALRSLD
jgi:uracil-DNA glycosylase